MSLRLNGSTSGFTEIDAPAIAGNNTLVLPTTNGAAHQLLKNSGTAGTWEYGVTLPSGNGLAHQLVKNSSSAGTWEYGFTLPSGNGLADQVLGGDGAGIISWVDRSRMVLETAKPSTSGTSVDFTDIPSWVKRVTVMMNGVSTTGTSVIQVQIGSGSFLTSGYNTGVGQLGNPPVSTSYTSGFGISFNSAASNGFFGVFTIILLGSNIWVFSGQTVISIGSSHAYSNGYQTLSGTLDRVRITTVNGTDTFDAGTINLLLEG